MRNESCKLCELHQSSVNVCVWGDGNPDYRIFLIGEAPGEAEGRTGKPFQGRSGQLLREELQRAGLPEDVYITNVAKCRPPDNRKPEPSEIKACAGYLQEEFKEHQPKFVLTLGATPTKALTKSAKITEVVGKIIERDGVKYMPCFHPAYVLRDPSKMPEFRRTLKRFKDLVGGKQSTKTSLPVRIIDRSNLEEFQHQFQSEDEFVYDLETSGLDHYSPDSYINCIGMYLPKSKAAWVLPIRKAQTLPPDAQKKLVWWMADQPVEGIGHNVKFDSLWIRRKFNTNFYNSFDTMLAHYMLDENSPHGLKELARFFLDAPDYDLTTSEKKGNVDADKLFTYCAWDCYYTYELSRIFRRELMKDSETRRLFNELMMPMSRLYEELECEGHFVQMEKFYETEKKLSLQLSEVEKKLNVLVGYEVNWNSPAQVGKALYGTLGLTPTVFTDKGAPSTGEAALAELSGHPIVEVLTEFRSVGKMLSTYIEGWKEYMVGPYLFLSTKLHGTVCVTGDTLIPTNRGVIPIVETSIGDKVLTHEGTWEDILDFIPNGIKPIYRVTLENGLQLKATDNHPYLSSLGWKRSDELKKGDVISVWGDPEEWRECEDFPKYEVSSWGRIRNKTSLVIRRIKDCTGRSPKGRKQVRLVKGVFGSSDEYYGSAKVHRLVAKAFIPNPRNLPEVRHLDGKAWNNHFTNLAWGTRVDNWSDTIGMGTNRKTRHPQAKLNWEKVNQIPYLRSLGWSCEKIGNSFDVSRKVIEGYLKGKGWKPEISKDTRTKFYSSRVIKVEILAPEMTYGIEVNNHHSHVTNGIVTHNTGRFSSRLHQVPRDGTIRNLISAPEGWTFIQADLSQAELRVAAIISRDPELIQCYRNNIDVHWRTAMGNLRLQSSPEMTRLVKDTVLKWGGDPELSWDRVIDQMMEMGHDAAIKIHKQWKEIRKQAKAINFGFLYSMGAKKFTEYAKIKYGWEISIPDAEIIRESFFSTYQALPPWHDRQKQLVKIDGYVRNLAGRKRRLPGIWSPDRMVSSEAERQAINSPVQGFIGDMKAMGMLSIYNNLQMPYGGNRLKIKAEVHDSILIWVKNEYLEEMIPKIKHHMEHPELLDQLGIMLPVPIVADIEVGIWGDGVTWKGG